jgi:hypothetical protein
MKQTLKLSFLLTLMVFAVAFADKNKERDELKLISTGKAISADQAAAASSPWLPRNLETATSQFKVVEFKKNGFVLIAGAKTTAPMLGNYYGFYSKDSGKSFTKFSYPNFQASGTSTSMRFASIATWGDSVMIKADYNGVMMRSTNYGVKWDTVGASYGTGAFYDGVNFISKDTVIAYGDGVDSTLYITRSTDRGATWTRVLLAGNLSPNFKTYVVASAGSRGMTSVGNTVWLGAYSNDGAIFTPLMMKSTDAGLTWTATEYPALGAKRKWSMTQFSFKNATNGYALITNSYTQSLHRTTDGGATWSDTINITGVTNVLNQQFTNVFALSGTSVVYASGYDGTAAASWKSTDDGATWTKLVTPAPLSGAQTSLALVSFLTENLGFAGGTRQFLQYTPTVELTFRVNTSTVPDTIKATSTVQMRGDGGATNGLLDWNGASPVRFTNIGGDYWQAKARFVPGATFPYKIFTNVAANVGAGSPVEHNGWEGNLNDPGQDGNRKMIVGQNDSTIALEFVNGSPGQQAQYWRPYTETDSLEVTFRVNMANQEDFNPLTQVVAVNGSFNGWGSPSFVLKQEANDGNNGTRYDGTKFYSGTFKLPLKKANTDTLTGTGIEYAYKFVQKTGGDTKWENVPDRKFLIKRGSADTTLYWKWWDDIGVKPPAGTDTAIVQFRVDMTRAIQTNGYVTGDTIQVRYGFANSAKVLGTKNMAKQGLTNIYFAVDSNVTGVNLKADGTGKPLVYQYYLVKNGQDFREVYYNFGYTGSDVTLAERRLLAITAKTTAALDTSKNMVNATRWPFWRNTRKLSKDVDVKFTVDMRPAYYQVRDGQPKDTLYDIQGPWTITKSVLDSIYKWGVAINGPAAGGWAAWGTSLYADAARKLYDDGTNGDAVAGDRIYTRIIKFYKDSLNNVVGQEFKFGIHGGDNEGGKGGFGNNHIENINDAASTATIASQFGSINPLYYDEWNYELGQRTDVQKTSGMLPVEYSLNQNFPNPFNPNTTISYALPNSGLVTLKVYNVLGQEVKALVNAVQEAGSYNATFDASQLSSGVYFYKLEAGSFTSVKKMMLLK